jgi:methyl-accepting chemotaxis protein
MNTPTSAPARTLSLQFKLLGALSLGLAVVVLCALAGLGSAWLNLSTTIPPEVARNAQAEGLQREFRMQVQEWKNVLLRGSDEALRTKHLAAFDAQGDKTRALAKGLASGGNAETVRLAQAFLAQHTTLEADYHGALEAFAASGYSPLEGDALVRGKDRALGTTLDALGKQTAAVAERAVQARSEQARRMLVLCAVLTTLAAGILMAVLAVWLRRSVIAPVVAVEAAARAVARGELDHTVQVRSRDEIGRLGLAMTAVTQTLKDVLAAQASMAQRHDAGEISYRMDASASRAATGRW